MKMNKFFMLAYAAMAFAACSNEDDPSSGDGTNGNGEMINTISIAFVDGSNGGKSRAATDGEEAGEGTENTIYHAFVFAKEANPEHAGALEGDWTVKEVGDGTTPLVSGNEGTAGTLGNMCSFKNVRQGDNVYVIANDPNMTFASASQLCHKGTESEDKIKAYVSAVEKSYINDLTIQRKKGVTPTGKFIMAGVAVIPTSPVIANGSTVTVPVMLDREVAKVAFSAEVTAIPGDEAYGKVQILDGTAKLDGINFDPADGIIVVRIPRQVSFFTKQDRDWYTPALSTQYNKDWKMKNDTETDADWKTVFPGDVNSDPKTVAAGDVKPFNSKMYDSGNVKEYRLTWQAKTGDQTNNLIKLTDGVLESPIFYTTPNYSDNAGCATVVCTQATYTGPDLLINSLSENKAYQALAAQLFDAIQKGATTLKKADGSTKADKLDDVKWEKTNIGTLLTYLSTKTTNDVAIKAALAKVYNITPGAADGDSEIGKLLTAVQENATNDNKTDASKLALVDYSKGMKLYYRADVAKYVGTTSLKNTERNSYYKIQGTITSLGAKTIDQAITSTEIGMLVQVVVNKWTVMVSKVIM